MIYEQIQKDKLVPGADRGLLSLIMSEICVDGKPMSDEDAIKELTILKKNTEKTIDLLRERDAGSIESAELIDDEVEFLLLVLEYLPVPASHNDIMKAIDVLGLEPSMKSMGPLMKHLKESFPVVDGNLVKSILLGK